MKSLPILLLLVFGFSLTNCTDKSKDNPEPQRIKLEQPTSKTEGHPVQIPMHGTKENSSSGITSFKLKEEMKEAATEKNSIQE